MNTTSLALETTAAKWIKRYPADAERILRGLQLAKRPGQVAALGDDLYLVRSEKGDTWYQVARGYCECPSHEYRPAERCKHRFCVSLLSAVSALPEFPTPSAEPQPALAVEAEPEEVERQWSAWEETLSALDTDHSAEASRWRRAEKARLRRCHAATIAAHEESQARLRWLVAKSDRRDRLNKPVQAQ